MYEKIAQYMSGVMKDLAEFAAGKLLPGLVLLVIGILTVKVILKLEDKMLQRTKLDATVQQLIRSISRTGLYVLVFLIVAPEVGINVSSLVALASVVTLAISLSLQNALSNMFGGYTLLYTKPFVVGDFVEIAAKTGTVQEVGLAYTRLLTADNKVISIPNSAVVAADVVNYTATGSRRVDIAVTASYDAPAQQVKEALLQAAKIPTALEEPAPIAALEHYGDSSIGYVLRVWCKSDVYFDTLYQVNENIKKEFDKAGIEMTYPHLNVHLDK